MLLAVVGAACLGWSYKRISGEPNEFGRHVLPPASASAAARTSFTRRITFAPAAEGDMRAVEKVVVDGDTVGWAFFSASPSVTASLVDSTGTPFSIGTGFKVSHQHFNRPRAALPSPRRAQTEAPLGDSGIGAPGTAWLFPNGKLPVGEYVLTLETDAEGLAAARRGKAGRNVSAHAAATDGFLVVWTSSDEMIVGHRASFAGLCIRCW